MVSDAVGPFNAISKVAADDVRIALDAGFRVTVVAKFLDESLRGDVEWLPLHVPRRGFAIQWLTGRHWIKKAIGDRHFDVLHVHQPQVADLADVYQCHFLTRVAYERRCLFDHSGIRAIVDRIQKFIVLHAEDYFYRRWNPNTRMLFDSDLTKQEFLRLYGKPALEQSLPYAFPSLDLVSDDERARAKLKWIGRVPSNPVIGYLGGIQKRKGYERLLRAMREERGMFLLLGGQYTDEADLSGVADQVKAVGEVDDTRSFYAACDVFAVPSLFEPLGLVAFEAAARGLAVIATREVGALPHLLEFNAGLEWNPSERLKPMIEKAVRDRARFRKGAIAMSEALGESAYAMQLLKAYESVIDRKSIQSNATTVKCCT